MLAAWRRCQIETLSERFGQSFGQSFWEFKSIIQRTAKQKYYNKDIKNLWFVWNFNNNIYQCINESMTMLRYNWTYHFFHSHPQVAVMCLLVHVEARPSWQRSTSTPISLQSFQILQEECQTGNLLQIHINGNKTQAKCDGTSTTSSTTSKSQ